MADPSLDELLPELRQKLRAGAPTAVLTGAQLRLLLDELGRLQQGNERLRRQNRRLRERRARRGDPPRESGPLDEATLRPPAGPPSPPGAAAD